jgi:Zn-dependent alcohol dehydrogenase
MRAEDLVVEDFKMLINGHVEAGASAIDVINPATELPFAKAPRASTDQLNKAVAAAKASFNRFPVDMPRLVDFYMSGKLDDLISRRLKLEEINSAFEELKRGGVACSVIVSNA